jgi:uncharacterized membrane protein
MARALVVLVVLWPLAQAAAVAAAALRYDESSLAFARAVGSRVCHQRPERSFHTGSVQWPVCARCSGVYVGAAVGVWFGFAGRLRRMIGDRRMTTVFLLASLPTGVTWIAEWGLSLGVTNAVRGAAAIPLGAVAGAVIVAVASSTPKRDQVN